MAIGDNNEVTGNPMPYTARQSFTPIYNSATMQVASANVGFYWREGQHLCTDQKLVFISASSAQVVTFTLPRIDGVQLTINSAVLSGGGSQSFMDVTPIGPVEWLDQSGGGYRILVSAVWSGTEVRYYHNAGYLDGSIVAAQDVVRSNFKIPIYEWS